MTFLDSVGNFFETALAFIVLISILVFIHEMGHFLAAKWCGIRADVFAIGMGPRLFGWNWKTGFSFGKVPEDLDLDGRTDYRVAAFPIGGYVKIAGMIDESMDSEFASRPPEPWEFRSKNTLQKAFVISAGVIMNFLLAVVIYAGLNMSVGKTMFDTTTVGHLASTDPAYIAGLRENDSVVAINGKPIGYFQEIWSRVYIDEAGNDVAFDVVRAGMPMKIVIPRSTISSDEAVIEKQGQIIPNPAGFRVVLAQVIPNSPADQGGFKAGDEIISIDDQKIYKGSDLVNYVTAHPTDTLSFAVERGGQLLTLAVTPDKSGKIGVYPRDSGATKRVDYSFGQAVVAGFNETTRAVGNIFKMIGSLFAGRSNLGDSVAGPLKIAQAAQKSAADGLAPFLAIMAFLSVSLATMNILPIPALDGGHLVFILIEGIMRREVPLKVRMVVQQIGFGLLLLLMVFIIGNDFWKEIAN